MDVITILQPENHVIQSRFTGTEGSRITTPFIHFENRESVRDKTVSVVALHEVTGFLSFSSVFLIFMICALSVTPLFQTRFGFYLFDQLYLSADTAAESAMRQLITEDSEAALLGNSAVSDLPQFIQTVNYTSYTVKKGDTVSAILLRAGLRNLSTILSVNKIANARRIRSGQVLKIPSMDGLLYTVKRGDNLAKIADTYGIPLNTLLDANDLSDAILVSGQTLFIPGATLSTLDLRRAMGELFIYPIKGRLTSPFGYRKDPFTGVRSFHTGIDLAAPTGTPIKAALDGKVATTGFSTVFGNYVIITHDGGYQSLYGHMSAILVRRGQRVVQGAIIGKVGNTGYSTGSHVHLSVYKNGKMIDPLSVLK